MTRRQMNVQEAVESAAANYHRAQQDFEYYDRLSKTRALSEHESRMLQRAQDRLTAWGSMV